MIILLIADELLDGEIKYPDEEEEVASDPILILPEKKEVKVKYIKDSKNDKKEVEGDRSE